MARVEADLRERVIAQHRGTTFRKVLCSILLIYDMVSREKQKIAASAVVALVVLVALRALTDFGLVLRFTIVVVVIFVTQSVFERVYQ